MIMRDRIRTVFVEVKFSQTEVDHEYLAPCLAFSKHEVRRLYISVDVATIVKSFDCVEHLDLPDLIIECDLQEASEQKLA